MSYTPHNYGTHTVLKSITDIRGKNITVMGLGLHGGGLATTRFLLQHGAKVTVTDMKTESELAPSVQALYNDKNINSSNLRFVLGKHDVADFELADCVIKNPGVKYERNPYLAKAKYIETDISLFLRFAQPFLIAVTGSKGKSSTVSALNYALNKVGIKTYLGGNITVSPLSFLDEYLEHKKTTALAPVILELSSWQLADLHGRNILKPSIALITPIMNDHQNWYACMQDYMADKACISENQTSQDYMICAGDKFGDYFAQKTKAQVLRYPKDIPATLQDNWVDTLLVPGAHNKQNILNTALVMNLLNIDVKVIKKALQQYSGLPHRLECFYKTDIKQNKLIFYNDSAATIPEASIAALEAFTQTCILIFGGTDKNLDFTLFLEKLEQLHTKKRDITIFLLQGTGTQKFISLLKKTHFMKQSLASDSKKSFDLFSVPFFGPYESLEQLLGELKNNVLEKTLDNLLKKEVIILFSPGAASFGLFKNEFDRGNQFKELVQQIF